MDFFASQDAARSRSRRLVGLFALAVVVIVVSVYLAAVLLLFTQSEALVAGGMAAALWQPELFAAVAVVTLAVIGAGSLYKSAQLNRGGGEGVATLLGGRPVEPDTTDPLERRLLNVVEEMAIAAGTPVPSVFVLDREGGINAFAAGLSREDAVIGVTRGCLQHLSRDELQGVIAHEMSHVLNGDMPLNLRLMGTVHGILVIALVGYWILRSGGGSSRGKKGGGLALFALALLVIGYVGVFFSKLIKSGVSRQRELLADTAAVQFTRNPPGLVGALGKIGALSGHGKLRTPKAEEASHMYFADGVGGAFLRVMASHPPLEQRIRRLDPSWDGRFPELTTAGSATSAGAAAASTPRERGEAAAERVAETLRPILGAAEAGGPTVLDPALVAASVGNPTPAHVAWAAGLLEALPPGVDAAARQPSAARAVVVALLLDPEEGVRRRQLAQVAEADAELHRQVGFLEPAIRALPRVARLPLLDLTLPSLRRLSAAQYGQLRRLVEALVAADEELSIFELALERVLLRHLDPWFAPRKTPPAPVSSLQRLSGWCAVLLSALAHAGHQEPQAAAAAFARGAEALLEPRLPLQLVPREECPPRRVAAALDALAPLTPARRKGLLTACAAAVSYDGEVTVREGELLRAVADSLDAPLPPLLGAV